MAMRIADRIPRLCFLPFQNGRVLVAMVFGRYAVAKTDQNAYQLQGNQAYRR